MRRHIVFMILATVVVLGLVGWYAYWRSQPRTDVLMNVRYVGGLCQRVECRPASNLYQDGTFENHKNVNAKELTLLKEAINKTDFTKYPKNPNPNCASFVDGADQVLAFPQKHLNQSFKLCELQIPPDDATIKFIADVINDHQLQ